MKFHFCGVSILRELSVFSFPLSFDILSEGQRNPMFRKNFTGLPIHIFTHALS